MSFKYYVYTDAAGMDGWVELSGAVQGMLENFDAIAMTYTTGAMHGFMFRVGELSHDPGRIANYEVRAELDQGVHNRLMRFNDGEVTEVRYVQEPPPRYEIGFHPPARRV